MSLTVVSAARRRQSAFVAGEAHVARLADADRMICPLTKHNKSFGHEIVHSVQQDFLLVG